MGQKHLWEQWHSPLLKSQNVLLGSLEPNVPSWVLTPREEIQIINSSSWEKPEKTEIRVSWPQPGSCTSSRRDWHTPSCQETGGPFIKCGWWQSSKAEQNLDLKYLPHAGLN
jgi:hypothetical protein